MILRDFWSKMVSKVRSWWRVYRLFGASDYQPLIDDQGLINHSAASVEGPVEKQAVQSNEVLVKAVQPTDKTQPLEKLQDGFNKLVEQLQNINEHLNRQAAQNEDLIGRISQLPKLLESFPAVVENQMQLTKQLFEQIKVTAVKNQQFIDTIEKIPTEVAKQTDALVDIDHQLAAAAAADVQMAESFNNFNETVAKLNKSTVSQTDSITQMSAAFATSDRYTKYLMSQLHRRFVWVFTIAIGVCVLAILILGGIIVYLKR